MLPDETYHLPRPLMARAVFGWLLLMIAYFFVTDSLVHQWEQPLLVYPEADNTYWLPHMLNIPQAIMRSTTASALFDVALLVSVAGVILFPRAVLFIVAAIAALWLYQIMYSSANGHHYHHAGMMIVPLAFLFRKEKHFYFSWHFIRFWILFLFASSGVYKLYYGGFFEPANMASILKLHYQPGDSFQNDIIQYLIQHEGLAQRLYQGATLLQLFCLVGFFTGRWDKWILTALLLFNIANFFLLRIAFWDNSLMIAPFLPWQRMDAAITGLRSRDKRKHINA